MELEDSKIYFVHKSVLLGIFEETSIPFQYIVAISAITAYTDFVHGLIVIATPSFWKGITYWEALSAAWITSAVIVFGIFL